MRGLPKLEGTVAVNLALINKFMPAYLFQSQDLAPVPTRTDAVDDEFLFRQGPARGLANVRFHDWRVVYARLAIDSACGSVCEPGRGLCLAAGKAASTAEQRAFALALVQASVADSGRFDRLWRQVEGLSGAYAMNP